MTKTIKVQPNLAAESVRILLEIADRATVDGQRNNAVVIGSPVLEQIYDLADKIERKKK